MKSIIRIFKYLEESGLLIERVSETIKNEAKEQTGGILSMLLGALGASLLGDILTGRGINRAGEGIVRTVYGNKRQDHKKNGFLMPPHPLTILKYRNIIQMNLDLRVLILEITYPNAVPLK